MPANLDLSKLDTAKIATHVCGLLAEIAKATPTPLDDLVVSQAEPIILAWLKSRMMVVRRETTDQEHYAVAEGQADADAAARLGANGVSPWMTAIVLDLLKNLIQR